MKRRTAARALMIVAGLINAAPAAAAIDPRRIEALYGVAVPDANHALLLRHRAVMLGIVGGGMIAGAFVPRIRAWTAGAGAVSMGSYIALAHAGAAPNAHLSKVERVDYAALAILAGALVLDQLPGRTSPVS